MQHTKRISITAALVLVMGLTGCAGFGAIAQVQAQMQRIWVACPAIHIEPPTWSPDGTTLAFAATDRRGLWVSYTVDATTGQVARVTGLLNRPVVTAWSPDGQRLLTGYDVDYYDIELFTVELDGSTKALPDHIAGLPESYQWSPDGQYLAVSSGGPDQDMLVMSQQGQILWRYSDDGSDLPFPGTLAWSPDGNQIAFELGLKSGVALALIDPQGEHLKLYTVSNMHILSIQWSPDGSQIAYSHRSKPTISGYLTVLRADGSDPRRIASGLDGPFVWLPSGSGLIYVTLDGEIRTISVDGADQELLATLPPDRYGTSFSKDGSMVAYLLGGRFGAFNLYMMNTDGSTVRQITNNPSNRKCLRWPF